MNVVNLQGGSLAIGNTANVSVVPEFVNGQLNPASDSGVSNMDAITNVAQPNFVGNTEPYSTVSLYVQPTAGGLTASLVAPRIFGSINAPNGSITGTIQTTGIQTDPITNAVSTVPSTIGRAYVITTITGQTATATTITAGSGPLSGTVFTPGDLISQVVASGGISGLVFAGGNMGVTENCNKTTIRNGVSSTQTLTALVGGVQSNGAVTGAVEALGNLVGNFTATGGLWGSGRLIIGGSMIGNVQILDKFGVSSAVIAGGSIGSSTYVTKLTLPAGSNQGTVAATSAITFASGTNTRSNAIFQNLSNVSASALAIDAPFTQLATDEAVVTSGAVLNTNALNALASDVARIRVVNGTLRFQ